MREQIDNFKTLGQWEWLNCDDYGDQTHTCELCGKQEVRYVHKLKHKFSNNKLNVGCVCAVYLMYGKEYNYDTKHIIEDNGLISISSYDDAVRLLKRRENRRIKSRQNEKRIEALISDIKQEDYVYSTKQWQKDVLFREYINLNGWHPDYEGCKTTKLYINLHNKKPQIVLKKGQGKVTKEFLDSLIKLKKDYEGRIEVIRTNNNKGVYYEN